jgi:hypothetical protein
MFFFGFGLWVQNFNPRFSITDEAVLNKVLKKSTLKKNYCMPSKCFTYFIKASSIVNFLYIKYYSKELCKEVFDDMVCRLKGQ